MIQAHRNKQIALAREHANHLYDWMTKNGFAPNITGTPDTDKLIAKSVAKYLKG